MDKFFQYYLMVQKKTHLSKNNTYAEFKKYVNEHNIEAEIKRISQYAKHYDRLIHPKSDPSAIGKCIRNIRSYNADVANPLLLKILADHASNEINEKDVIDIFQFVDSYLLRCKVCETDKGLNKIFPQLLSVIDGDNYVKSIEKAIMNKNKDSPFPRDPAFKGKLLTFQIYIRPDVCKYVLERLEHQNSKERVSTSDLQIEHVMPNTLTDKWKASLGESWESIHEQYKDTIGNLTLTGHNQELGNMTFKEKQRVYKDSKLNISVSLTEGDYWNEERIRDRAKNLAEQAVRLWKCPAGYGIPHDDGSGADTEKELEHLGEKDIQDLWYALKEEILNVDSRLKFHMTNVYGAFRIISKNGINSIGICGIEALNNKIYVTYNCKITDGVIPLSKAVEDISDRGHYYNGDLRSTVMSKEDIPGIVNNIREIIARKAR